MSLDEKLQDVTIVGAAGKMGSGIALLLAQEMAFLKLSNPDKTYALHLVDISEKALNGLWHYIRKQVVRTGEKQVLRLREIFKERVDLVYNEEMIQEFTYTVLSLLRPATAMEVARNSLLVFEAVIENAPLKIELFKKLKQHCAPNALFFTNTSSIPLHYIQKQSGLEGRIIGLHFYNPPAVQKLLEIIPAENSLPELEQHATELVKRLHKTAVYSKDIAGFIGNGHFIREGVFAFQEVRRLEKEYGLAQAIYLVNKTTQDFLLRPMGIFQLIDYVGIDVFQCIQKVMSEHLQEDLSDELVEKMVAAKALGGQHSDGSQKDGFFKYIKNHPAGVYEPASENYLMFEEKQWTEKLDEKLGALPIPGFAWKKLLTTRYKQEKIEIFFSEMKKMETLGAELAKTYLNKSRQIAQKLVTDGVAKTDDDVNTVLKTGFFHLYGPIQNYLD